jgi:hypothetical protein
VNRRDFVQAAAFAAAQLPFARAAGDWSLENDPTGYTLRSPDGKIVLTYLVRKPEGVLLEGNSVCCFHPFNAPSGQSVTAIAPPDHRDHRGLFFAWLDVEFHRNNSALRGDFWGWGHFAPTQNRVIENRSVRLARSDATSATLEIHNDWKIEGQPVMAETCEARTSTGEGARLLDLTFRFESDYDVTVNQVAFSGLCLRSLSGADVTYSSPRGAVDLPDSNALKPETDWPASPWYSRTVRIESGHTITAALVDHPSNPVSTWHEPRGVAFLNPCISAARPVSFPSGKPLILRYRAMAMDGPANTAAIDSLAHQWRS